MRCGEQQRIRYERTGQAAAVAQQKAAAANQSVIYRAARYSPAPHPRTEHLGPGHAVPFLKLMSGVNRRVNGDGVL